MHLRLGYSFLRSLPRKLNAAEVLTMCKLCVFMTLISIAICAFGCRQKKDVALQQPHINSPVHQEPWHHDSPKHDTAKHDTAKHGESRGHSHNLHHSDHHHAFENPVELSAKWNDPQRDRWQYPDQIVEALSLKPGETVADIGAGTGYMVAHLSREVGKDGTVIAIDAESAMIEYLISHKSQLGPAAVVPQKVGFSDPELEPGSVHGVLTLDTWHHVADREAYARKVFTGLKNGGRFVVVDYEVDAEVGPPQQMRLSPDQVIRQLEEAGFRAEVVPESMPFHYMVVGHKGN
ncbi:class I SAM-dependent methyltransferase [Pirellulaceae bacterium SH467]